MALLDPTAVKCGRWVDTVRRSQLCGGCAHHYSRSRSRWFCGMRLHLLGAPDGTMRAVILALADDKERDVSKRLFAIRLRGGETIIAVAARPQDRARQRPASLGPPPARRIDLLDPQRPTRPRAPRRARTLHVLRARIAAKLLADSPGIWLNWHLGRPSRTVADLTA
jgi:hypothetical protein